MSAMNTLRPVLALRGMLMRLNGGKNYGMPSRSPWHSSARLDIRRPRTTPLPPPSTPSSRPETGEVKDHTLNLGQARATAVESNELKIGEVTDGRTNVQPGGYGYFKNFAEQASSVLDPTVTRERKSPQNLSLQSARTDNSLEVPGDILNRVTKGKMIEVALKSDASVKPALPKKSFNLAAYVGESETLTNLVKLGVDLTKIELDAETSSQLVKLNFEADVQPYLAFLHRNGVLDADVGVCLTRNPKIFLVPLDDLETRINYLKSKKFDEESIGRILSKFPQLFSLPTKQIDGRLGFLQKEFKLSGKNETTIDRISAFVLMPQMSVT